jgi:dihydroneopterin aldolase
VKVELRGLELRGHHGATHDEQERGQLFVYDVELEVGQRGTSDRLEDAVDYSRVAAIVREVAETPYRLLEALATAIADRLVAEFGVERARVRVRKPEVRLEGVEVEFAAATVERP